MIRTAFFIAALGVFLYSPSASMAEERMEEEEEATDISATLELCFSCHGENGAAEDASIPILAGQNLHYIYTQLKDYKAGRRAGPIMGPIAAEPIQPTELA